MSIDVDTEWDYENNTESNVEQDIGDVKERRFTEAEQVRTVYEQNEEGVEENFSHFFTMAVGFRQKRCLWRPQDPLCRLFSL